jgi:putative spermidine/putrescine transport system ATP-binding protein/mannopine transport system ATP-binding protein
MTTQDALTDRAREAVGAGGGAPGLGRRPAANVEIDRLSVRYRDVAAVDNVSLDIKAGEFLALLGPSGSGKTTVLMAVAGFTRPSSGDIRMSGKSVIDMPPERRGIGVVFQGYALFPHLTVEANVAFPLEMRGVSPAQIRDDVQKALETVGLGGLGARYPHELSGGQQQRVALARALVFGPSVLLLDEPLGALDKDRRGAMQREFRALHREVGTTIVYVTHDQQEALAMADRIAVMEQGRIIQLGAPREIFGAPKSRFVAGFIGDCNFLTLSRAERHADRMHASVQAYQGDVPTANVEAEAPQMIAVRPHHASLVSPQAEGVDGHLVDVLFLGELTEYVVALKTGEMFRLRQITDAETQARSAGEPVRVSWQWQKTRLF